VRNKGYVTCDIYNRKKSTRLRCFINNSNCTVCLFNCQNSLNFSGPETGPKFPLNLVRVSRYPNTVQYILLTSSSSHMVLVKVEIPSDRSISILYVIANSLWSVTPKTTLFNIYL